MSIVSTANIGAAMPSHGTILPAFVQSFESWVKQILVIQVHQQSDGSYAFGAQYPSTCQQINTLQVLEQLDGQCHRLFQQSRDKSVSDEQFREAYRIALLKAVRRSPADVLYLEGGSSHTFHLIIYKLLRRPPDMLQRVYQQEIENAIVEGKAVFVASTEIDPRDALLARRSDQHPPLDQATAYHLSGQAICRLMRRYKVTIDAIAAKNQITKKRVREVRTTGVTGFLASEWHYMITGKWLDELRIAH